jgi:sugar/nucleoside kinase (ribokinase family)
MSHLIDLLAIGSPVVDLLARVDDEFVHALEGGKGGMELVDAAQLEAMLGKLLDGHELAPGGSAGNTAYAAGRLGTKVGFLGKLGNCDSAQFYRDRFAGIGADVSRFKVGSVPNARCLSLVTPDSQRTMRTDLGAAMTLAPEEITAADFEGVRHVHMEGYLAFNRDLKLHILEHAKQAGCSTSFDMASFEVVRASHDVLDGWLRDYIDIVFANEDEAKAFFPDLGEDYPAMAARFSEYCDIAAVKLGKDGSLVAREGEVSEVEPHLVERPVDTTGAGDYWAGGFLNAWLDGESLPESGRRGSKLGAEVVQVIGASLPDNRWQEIRRELGID